MAFVKIVKGSTGGYAHTPPPPEVRMGAHRNKTGKSIYLSITDPVIQQLKWKTETRENRTVVYVDIQEGVGDDAGFWLICESSDRPYVIGKDTDRSHAFTTNLTASKMKHYVLNDDQMPVHLVEFTVDEKERTILIQCPDWLRYNPQSYKEPPKLELTPPPTQPKRVEDKKQSRPTISVVKEAVVEASNVLGMNRQERRAVTAATTRAMRK